MSKGVKLYFMRHGETILNRYNRMQGWADALLTEEGRQGIAKTGEALRHIPFSAVYTSDLSRTVATAQIILANNVMTASDITIQQLPEFREEYFGSLEGLEAQPIWDDMAAYVSEHFDPSLMSDNELVRRQVDAFHAIDPEHDAEDFLTFWTRVEKGLIEVTQRHRETDQNILIVSHGMTIRNMLHELIPEFSLDTFLDNGSVSIVRYQDGHYHLDSFNQLDNFN
ncbi:MAG: histidine phosphatase family protein [Aerococcus sp.]|nr:histidine phosphatase family protein [Aerococcus sp.]